MLFGIRLFRQKLNQLEQRIAALEAALYMEERSVIPPQHLESSISLPAAWDESLTPVPPTTPKMNYVSKHVQISERLTSYDFAVRAQLGQAALFSLAGLFVGGLATAMFDLVWYAAILIGLAIGALDLAMLLLDHRGLVHKVVNQQNKPKQKPKPLRVEIKQPADQAGLPAQYQFLYLNGTIAHSDIRSFAQNVVAGKSLAIHGWTGVAGWTRPKLDQFFTELEKMGYCRPGRGNKPRELTSKGKALFRALAES